MDAVALYLETAALAIFAAAALFKLWLDTV